MTQQKEDPDLTSDAPSDVDARDADPVRQSIIAIAADLYGQQGYGRTSPEDICRAAGITANEFTTRYTSTEDLFCNAYRHAFEALRATLWEALSKEAGDPETLARRGLTAFYRFLKLRPTVARLLFCEVLRVGPQADALYHAQINDMATLLNALLGALYEEALPDTVEKQKWLMISLVAAICGNAHMWVLEDFATEEDVLIQTTVTLFRGIVQQWLSVLRLDKKLAAANTLHKGAQYVRLGYMLPLLDYLRDYHLPAQPVLERLGIDESDLGNDDRMITASRVTEAFVQAYLMSGDTNIGLHVGERMRLPCLGIFGQLAQACESVREVLMLYKRFGAMIRNTGSLDYELGDSGLYFTFHEQDGSPQRERQQVELILAGILTIGRNLADQYLTPDLIEFPFPEPADTSEHQRFFRCPLRFDCPELRCYISTGTADLRMPGTIPELRQALEAEATRQLRAFLGQPTDADPQIARLKQYVSEHVKKGVPELAVAAQALKTTPRNLQRLLEARRSSYSEIVDEVRRDMAVIRLQDTGLSLVVIASELGFADQSSFSKAFKRWVNTTPTEYRKHQLGQ
jgi:AraC-like DNA-binding protein/AcrR family transcriptional regulator